jgi:site-specific recombinase XerD
MRGLWIDHRRGQRFYRTRRGGKLILIELPADLPIDHPDFIAAWADAARSVVQSRPAKTDKPKAGTIASVWSAITASKDFRTKSLGYQAMLIRHSTDICKRAGHIRCAVVTEKHIRADVADAEVPSARLKTWRVWGIWCETHAIIDTDPATHVKPIRQPATEGHPPWTAEHVATFRARWPIGTSTRAVMELIHWTGCRISDAVRIGPQMIDRDGVLVFRQQKTNDFAYVPWSCTMPGYATALDADRQLMIAAIAPFAGHLTFLPAKEGRSRSSKALGMQMQKACRATGIPVTAHGLRKTRAIALSELGANERQIGAWTGHHSFSEIRHYTEGFNRRAAVMGTDPDRKLDAGAK